MDAGTVGRAVRRRWLPALLVLALTLASTVVYLRTRPVRYTATATAAVVPSPDPVKSQGFEGLIGTLLPTLAVVASSREIVTAAVARVPGSPPVDTVLGEVSANSVEAQLLLRVSVTDADPRRAADLANTIASLLPAYNLVSERVSFRSVELAVPGERTAPQTKVILLLGLLLGLGLAVAAAVALDALRAGRPEDVAVETGAATTGAPQP